ncbi:MAG: TauD/TfdA family dioxygenase [Acidimicrobiales bacterium]|nr:TauD/TfdA family dioxygenase [Acidimicrobiales bacterium]
MTSTLQIDRVGGGLGAVIAGVRLAEMSDDTFAAVHRALVTHGVVFFRDQHLTADEQLALAQRFGQCSIYPIERMFGSVEPGQQVIVDDENSPPGTDLWHTDVSWLDQPPKFAVLTCLEVPAYGGDTMWCSTEAAYNDLSPAMQGVLAGLRAVHSCWPGFCEIAERKSGFEGLAERIHAAYPDQLHPIVRTNPDTGAKALYLTDRTVMQSIEGMSQAESDVLLDFLLAHVDQPRFHVRWHWAEGDIAIWDERTTLHRGVSDHHPQRRVVRRCTVDGEVPA